MFRRGCITSHAPSSACAGGKTGLMHVQFSHPLVDYCGRRRTARKINVVFISLTFVEEGEGLRALQETALNSSQPRHLLEMDTTHQAHSLPRSSSGQSNHWPGIANHIVQDWDWDPTMNGDRTCVDQWMFYNAIGANTCRGARSRQEQKRTAFLCLLWRPRYRYYNLHNGGYDSKARFFYMQMNKININ